MFNITDFTNDLVQRDGIYYSRKEAAISYPEHGNQLCYQLEENSFWFKHRNNCIKAVVQKYCNEKLFFDVGGGNGYTAKGLNESGMDTVLIEPGINGCLNAQKRGVQHIVCSTLEDASFRQGMIPAVGLFDVVEHIEDDHGFLGSIQSYLTEGGLIFITVPAYSALWSKEDVDAGHYRRYSMRELERTVQQAGFELVYSTYIFSVLPLPVFLFRTLPHRLGLKKKAADDLSKYKREHQAPKGFFDKLINRIWQFELKQIQLGKKVSVGGSCLLVAKKKTTV